MNNADVTATASRMVTLLFMHTGEVSYTAKDPIGEVVSQEGNIVTYRRVSQVATANLTDTATCILSNDDWRAVEVEKYAVVAVEIPEWMSVDEYIGTGRIRLKYIAAQGANRFWPETTYRVFEMASPLERRVMAKLLTTKTFRSAFRADLADKLVAFITTPVDQRRYDVPFSARQIEALCGPHDALATKRAEDAAYRAR